MRLPAVFLLPLVCVPIAAQSEATIEIYAARLAAYQIPRSIYGTFLEPIGNSIYGGLWAQVLENPSFEDNLWGAARVRQMLRGRPALATASSLGLPLPWEPLDASQGMRYEPRWGDAANSARSLLLMALPNGQTGVRQQVYLPVHRVLKYTGNCQVKHVSGPGALEISLRRRSRPEATLAKASLSISGDGWKEYTFSLELEGGQLAPLEPADFVIAASAETRVLLDQVLLFPADAVDGMDPEMIGLARELKTPVVRFGGNFTSGYHWRDGVGPMVRRVSMLNQSWSMPEYNHFGTDEFLRFCRLIGAEPQIALNLGSGTPEEAAQWVEYVNRHSEPGRGGLLWELGNELWGTFQIGYPTEERVAARTKSFSDAVRAVDPKARLIATGQDPDHFASWNAKQLALGPATFQYLSTHFVVNTDGVRKNNPQPEFVALSAFALPVGLERHLREMKAQIDGDPGTRGRVQVAFTEWLFNGPNDSVPRFSNMGGAICTAGFLNTLMRVADFTTVSDMTGLMEFGGIWKKRGRVYAVPAYWAFRMYSRADAVQPVETHTEVAHYDIAEGNRRIPEIPDVPYLDVVAALNRDRTRLTLFCVNRDTGKDIRAKIRLSGFRPGEAGRVETLAAENIYETNDEVRPDAVRPVEGRFPVAGPSFEYTFRRASVTLLEVPSRP